MPRYIENGVVIWNRATSNLHPLVNAHKSYTSPIERYSFVATKWKVAANRD